MERYGNLSGDSGVARFEIGRSMIIVEFRDGKTYEYTDEKPGAHHVARMKELAPTGRGLATYINKHVRDAYARRIR